jgi:ABC-type nitrate/sulfonate/bicarbonate transport system substrate-binding protein
MVDKIKIIGFEKDLALWAAETKGFFAAQDLTIAFTQTRNSTEEIAGLLDGTWNIAFDNGDNVVAWDEGHGADGGSRHSDPPNRARSSSENRDHAISRACPG